MDRAYKNLFLRQVKDVTKSRYGDFKPFGLEENSALWDVFTGGLLYRKALPSDRFVWINWFPGPGVERYFHVYLGWSLGGDSMPGTESHHPALLTARAAVPGLAGGCLDLEQIEGKNALGGITIPSPWDQLLLIKVTASKAIQREAQMKAYMEASALTEENRKNAVAQTLADVFDRIDAQLPAFVSSVVSLPD